MANGIVPSDASPHMLLIPMEQQQLMTDFLTSLGSPIDPSGFVISSTMPSTLAIATDKQVINFLNLTVESISKYHEKRSIAMNDEF